MAAEQQLRQRAHHRRGTRSGRNPSRYGLTEALNVYAWEVMRLAWRHDCAMASEIAICDNTINHNFEEELSWQAKKKSLSWAPTSSAFRSKTLPTPINACFQATCSGE